LLPSFLLLILFKGLKVLLGGVAHTFVTVFRHLLVLHRLVLQPCVAFFLDLVVQDNLLKVTNLVLFIVQSLLRDLVVGRSDSFDWFRLKVVLA